jgi:hypothetical protein
MKLGPKALRLLLLVATAALTMGTSTGVAAASSVSSITTVLPGTIPQTPPFFVTAQGSFTAYTADGSVLDTGTLTAHGLLPAQPPKATQIETFRTFTSSNGNGTLQLHCSEISRPRSPYVTTGSCAVLQASGVYAGLAGAGELTGLINTNVSPPTLTDTILF